MDARTKKRGVIAAIYLFIFTVIAVFFYYLLKPIETCLDKIKNQNEEETDCGGVCPKCKRIEAVPFQIIKTGFVESGIAGKYDVYAQVENPNNLFGSSEVSYIMRIKDSSGAVLKERSGKSFILPKEKKFIVENVMESGEEPSEAEFVLTSVKWVEFNEYYAKPTLKILNKNYNQVSSGVGFAEVVGIVKNDSPFDFEKIRVVVVLKDEKEQITALNSTEVKTVTSGEEREFTTLWPNRFSGNVANMEVVAEVNIFNAETFIKKYYKSEKFQEYVQ